MLQQTIARISSVFVCVVGEIGRVVGESGLSDATTIHRLIAADL